MQVRLLRPADADVVQGLLMQLGYIVPLDELTMRIERVLANGSHYAAVAQRDGRVTGLVHIYERLALERPCQAVVEALVVQSCARRSGVGKLMMDAAEFWARSKGIREIALHTRIDRSNARSFYERVGYTRAATSHLMAKSLEAEQV